MARANLNLNKEVSDAFISAQDNTNMRIIKVRIQSEEMVLDGAINSVELNVEQDFETILPDSLSDTEACLVLYRLTEGHASNWLLIGIIHMVSY
jgi:hypothetical protein